MTATECRFLLALLLLATTTHGARVSQRLIGGHAKVEAARANKNEEPPEEKKTLSQQVAEGKYGLIQKEIFEKPPKRLGVLSYEKNADVPKDNENSLGGLGPDEIWLAEDHLLVLKGGSFHRTASEMPWPPIDDYRAPNRQVKIPSQPKVPPPFPVQLAEGGPLQFLGLNITRAPNGSLAIPGPDGAPPFFLPFPGEDPTNASAGGTPFQVPPYSNGAGPENFNRGNGPGPFPYPFPPPPPPNLNQSIDEDDPSIYYPPPYSFFYPKDNSTQVPPGPLVPGIVLPPPPDFFAPLDSETTTTRSSTTSTTTTTPAPHRLPPQRTHLVTTTPDIRRPPNRYLPYDNTKPKIKDTQANVVNIPTAVTTKPNLVRFHEVPYDENELAHAKPITYSPIEPTISTVPVLRNPYTEHGLHPKPYTSTHPPATESPAFRLPYDAEEQRPRTRLRPTAPPTTTPTVYLHEQYEENERTPSRVMIPPYGPTVSAIPVIQVPKTYLRPTTAGPVVSNSISQAIPVVQVSYGGETNDRPRTYLKPATGSPITNTVSPVPVLQVPYNDQRPRTYLKPTGGPQIVHTSPISVQYLPYNNNNNRVKPTAVPHIAHTVSTVPVLRVPSRTQVSSTAVPLKNYYSDVNTNSVQPHAEYYFYEEDSTRRPQPSPPQRLRYVAPTNFEKHIHQLRQQIQSYLKPSARPVYEYSFQAANYRPTKPPARYLTPAPPQQYINHRQAPQRYQQQPQEQSYYTKQDDRILDDITKKYFTVFGQKITTPVTPSLSLSGDTLINYRKPRPQIHPDAEYINIRPQHKQQPGGPGTFISYELPGEGAHFYFLTPQLVQQQRQQQRQQQQQQQNAYYYEKPEDLRIPRRNQR